MERSYLIIAFSDVWVIGVDDLTVIVLFGVSRVLSDSVDVNRGSNNSSFQIIKRGDYYIELLETFPCNNRERYESIKYLNKSRPYFFRDEKREERLLYDKINKERIKEMQRKLKEENRDHINELKLANYHKNKKPPTEEQLQVKKLRIKEQMEQLRAMRKKKERETDY